MAIVAIRTGAHGAWKALALVTLSGGDDLWASAKVRDNHYTGAKGHALKAEVSKGVIGSITHVGDLRSVAPAALFVLLLALLVSFSLAWHP